MTLLDARRTDWRWPHVCPHAPTPSQRDLALWHLSIRWLCMYFDELELTAIDECKSMAPTEAKMATQEKKKASLTGLFVTHLLTGD
jgi:hypothetical protein